MNRGNDASSTVLVQPGILVQNIDLPRIDQQAYQVAALGAAVDMFHREFAQASTVVAYSESLGRGQGRRCRIGHLSDRNLWNGGYC